MALSVGLVMAAVLVAAAIGSVGALFTWLTILALRSIRSRSRIEQAAAAGMLVVDWAILAGLLILVGSRR